MPSYLGCASVAHQASADISKKSYILELFPLLISLTGSTNSSA